MQPRKAMVATLATYILANTKAWLRLNQSVTWARYSNQESVRP